MSRRRIGGATTPRPRCVSALVIFLLGLLLPATPAAADTSFGEGGSGSGQMQAPTGIAVSEREGGDIYVDDAGNQRIDQFTPDGTWVRAFGWGVRDGGQGLQACVVECQAGEGGEGVGQLQNSDAIAVDDAAGSSSFGDVYVIDQNDFRVEKFGPAGEFLLMFGGGVDHTTGSDVCTAADVATGDVCGAGEPGTGPAHFYQDLADPRKSWALFDNNSIAVGPDGTVYVGDYGRVQEFDSGGHFAGEFILPVPSGRQSQFVVSLAVDASGDLFERSAVYAPGAEGELTIAEQTPGVREFDPAHVLTRAFDESEGDELTQVSLDQDGNLFVTDYNDGKDRFREFRSSGLLYANIADELSVTMNGSGGAPAPPSLEAAANRGIVADDLSASLFTISATEVFGTGQSDWHVTGLPLPQPGPPSIEAEDLQAGELEPTTATLHGAVNPHGFATEFHFEYGETMSYGQTISGNLTYVDQLDRLQEPLSGLATDTVYHWRLVAESECEPTADPGHICVIDGPDRTFRTLAAASVEEFTTQTVGPESVELKALINPNNSPTHYLIRYGTDTGYSGGVVEGQLKTGDEFRPVIARFVGLSPNTEYHYQLVATNGNGPGGSGEFETPDQTFTTEPSQAEERAGESCSNTLLREENDSTGLPDCRAYEQVSPTLKNGGQAGPSQALAAEGETVQYASGGVFAGAHSDELLIEYLASRTAEGWISRPVLGESLPGYQTLSALGIFGGYYSRDLQRSLFIEAQGISAEHAQHEGGPAYFALRLPDGSYVHRAGPEIRSLEGVPPPFVYQDTSIEGASEDLSDLYLGTQYRLLPADDRPINEVVFAPADRLYQLSGVGTADPTMSLFAEVPPGLRSITEEELCFVDAAPQVQPWVRTVSADASTVAYTLPIENEPGTKCGESSPNPIGLYVRADQGPPIRLNAPPASQCTPPSPCATSPTADPHLEGVSPDGRLVWFVTSQALLDSDRDSGNDLYLAELREGNLLRLVRASSGPGAGGSPAEGADVKSVLTVSQDGSHVAYVATGVLSAEPNSLGTSAAVGADNLYVYDAEDEENKFVARLCSGPEMSGSVTEPNCPAPAEGEGDGGFGTDAQLHYFGLEDTSKAPAELTPDGRYLLFLSHGRLEPGDTDGAVDAYRYDFATGALQRVSGARDGNDGDGNDDAYPVSIASGTFRAITSTQKNDPSDLAEDRSRSISADGSVVVFKTAAPLVSGDHNTGADPTCEGQSLGRNGEPTGCDAYEWEAQGHGTCREAGGCIRLISDGVESHGIAGEVLVDGSGRDITFTTSRNVIPADTDGVGDIYDARQGGGFPYVPEAASCGSAETCHGPLAPPPPIPSFTTEGESGSPAGPGLKCAKNRVRRKRHGQVRCVRRRPHKMDKGHHKGKHHHRSKVHHERTHKRGRKEAGK